ncbi:MAG TPA: hypothetical protein DGC56_06445 [Alistipes putredinis]|nr:hypothetical protein [Alistipes putredinis]
METPKSLATSGRIPIMTNSAIPRANVPKARAIKLFFINRLFLPTAPHSGVRNLFRNFRILRTAPQLDNTARPKHGLLIRRTKIAHIFPSSA